MTEEAKAAKREYQREWQRKNKDKVQQYCRKYWEKVAAQETQAAAEKEVFSAPVYTRADALEIMWKNKELCWEDRFNSLKSAFDKLNMTDEDKAECCRLLTELVKLKCKYD